MRLAVLGTRGLPPRYGGFEVFAHHLSLGLAERGWDVTVYCPRGAERPPRYEGRVSLRYVPHPSGPAGSAIYDALSLWDACARGFDVLLMLGYASAPALLIPKLWGVPVALNPDGMEWRRPKWSGPAKAFLRACETLGARLSDLLVCDARAVADYFRSRRGRPSVVIPYGASPSTGDRRDLLDRLGLRPGEYYVSVTRIEPENSVADILDGFRRARGTKRLVIVGGRPTRYFRETIEPRLRNAERVSYLETYDREASFGLRRHAFAYLHGNTVGGTSPALLEAMACGSLVIAQDNVFSREVLGDAGVYFASGEDLAGVLERLEAAPAEETRRLRERAAARVAETYTWDRVVDAYARALSGLRSRSQSSRISKA